MEKILIVPDVHGRTFWKKAIELVEIVDKVIFLGDYLDPYPHEGISKDEAITNFREILKFKHDNFNKVTLLIGNHDLHYWPEFKRYWGCRRDDTNFDEISELFINNLDYFQVSFIRGKYLFTHAGVVPGWLDIINDKRAIGGMVYSEINECEPLNIDLDSLDTLLNNKIGRETLYMVSRERGGDWQYGSCLWADLHEHMLAKTIEGYYQIFAHTMPYPTVFKPFIGEEYAMLDSQHCYTLDVETGNFVEEENA